MKFSTIWSIPAMAFSERLRRTRDWGAIKIGRALPLRVRYWVTIVELGQASRNSPDVPATSLDYLIENMDRPKYVS